MFTWFARKKALIQRCVELNARLQEARQVASEQRKQILTLQAANRVLKAQAASSRVKQSAPKPTVINVSNPPPRRTQPAMPPGPPRSITPAPAQSTKRAEDSGSDFLTGALAGLVVSEIFRNDDDSRRSSNSCSASDSHSSSSSDSSPSSGGGGDFGGGGASGEY